jgi:flagellar basal-body rod protein FlgB
VESAVFDDVTSTSLHVALSGLAERQRMTATNISNIQTPGYHAGVVRFEDTLRRAVADHEDPAGTRLSIQTSLEPTRLDGNNVNLDHETLSNVDTGLRYQLALRGVDAKFGLLRTAIGNG